MPQANAVPPCGTSLCWRSKLPERPTQSDRLNALARCAAHRCGHTDPLLRAESADTLQEVLEQFELSDPGLSEVRERALAKLLDYGELMPFLTDESLNFIAELRVQALRETVEQSRALGQRMSFSKGNGRRCANLRNQMMRRFGLSQWEADDVLQDGMVKVIRGLDSYDGEGPFWAWMRKIVERCALDTLTRRGRNPATTEFDDNLPTVDANGDTVVLPGTGDGLFIRAALSRLTDLERVTVTECAVLGKGYAELGRETGRHESTVRQTYRRALKKLRAALEDEE